MIAVLLALSMSAGVTAQQHLTFTPAAAQLVRVQTANGSIRVTTGGSKIVVTVTKKADSQSGLVALGVSTSTSGGTVALRATFPDECTNCSVSFDVTVPKGLKLDLSSTNGSVSADGISGDATLASTNGSVSATYASASPVRDVEMSSLNGSVSLALPGNARLGHVSADTKVGSFSNDWGLSANRGMVGASLDATVNANGISIKLSTMNGSISLTKS